MAIQEKSKLISRICEKYVRNIVATAMVVKKCRRRPSQLLLHKTFTHLTPYECDQYRIKQFPARPVLSVGNCDNRPCTATLPVRTCLSPRQVFT